MRPLTIVIFIMSLSIIQYDDKLQNSGNRPLQTQVQTVEDVGELQNLLHETTTAFACGVVLQANKLLPGARKNCLHPAWKNRFNKLEALLESGASKLPEKKEKCAYQNAANILAGGYQFLDTLIKQQKLEDVRQRPVFTRQLKEHGALHSSHPVLYAFKEYWAPDFGDVLAGVYVHGSYSTKDTNAYSDFDTLVVLRRSVVKDGEALYAFGCRAIKSYRYLLQADLLQHHGSFVLTEIDFDCYCDAYFPSVLFEYATALFQAKELGISHIRDSRKEALAYLYRMCQRFSGDWERKHFTVAYHLKLQLSCFMILPAVLLEVLGKPCYKRESFLQAKPLFPSEIWLIMDEVSELRTHWRQTNSQVLRKFSWFQPYLWSQIVAKNGRWSVPLEIWDTVRNKAFRVRMGVFAKYCITLAEMEAKT